MFEVFRQSLCTKNGQPFSGRYILDMQIIQNQNLILATSISGGGFSNYIQGGVTCFNSAGQLVYAKTIGDTISQGMNQIILSQIRPAILYV
jgi:hypothetical protein